MAKHSILLKLDGHLVAKIDKEVAESDGAYTSRAHLLRQLIASYYPPKSPGAADEPTPIKRLPSPPPLQSPPPIDGLTVSSGIADGYIEAALARADADLREQGVWDAGDRDTQR